MVVVALKIKRTDIGENEPVLKSLEVEDAEELDDLKRNLAKSLDIPASEALKKVFKLRSADGALIPLRKIVDQQCEEHDQLQLEVTNFHQTFAAKETERPLLSETLENIKLYKERMKKRVDRLEEEAPLLMARRDEAMLKQISQLSTQLHYLSDRLDEMAASGSSSSSHNQYQ
ncbi:uncharacterized protein LOC132199688 isoform X2 [Neocloeon triangulifer]|uniref:uncharacterized protein LOC132199688 isoform X2 n=1 Tax=Neocloeon triangulifer TaxID=2078957 RepID=UPI00286ECBFA|nr:uncharacterized protein LOC132199688 isoform X2 [Neocloeon triangulifer]